MRRPTSALALASAPVVLAAQPAGVSDRLDLDLCWEYVVGDARAPAARAMGREEAATIVARVVAAG